MTIVSIHRLGRVTSILAFVVLVISQSALPGQETEVCKPCKGTGWTKCSDKSHRAVAKCAQEKGHICLQMARATCCYGTFKRPCETCSTKAAIVEFRALRDSRKAWLKKVREVDLSVGGKFGHANGRTFLVHCSLPEWRFNRIGKRKRDEAAHIIANRLEEIANQFEAITGMRSSTKIRVFMNANLSQHLRALGTFDKKTNSCQYVFRNFINNKEPAFYTYPSYEGLYGDKGLDAHLRHHATHLLIACAGKVRQVAPPAWIDVGLCHWLDIKEFKAAKDCSNFCIQAAPKGRWAEPKRWSKELAKEVRSGSGLDFNSFEGKMTPDLSTHREHAYAWSFVAYLIADDREAFKKFFQAWKGGKPLNEALEISYGRPLKKINAAWKKRCASGRIR